MRYLQAGSLFAQCLGGRFTLRCSAGLFRAAGAALRPPPQRLSPLQRPHSRRIVLQLFDPKKLNLPSLSRGPPGDAWSRSFKVIFARLSHAATKGSAAEIVQVQLLRRERLGELTRPTRRDAVEAAQRLSRPPLPLPAFTPTRVPRPNPVPRPSS